MMFIDAHAHLDKYENSIDSALQEINERKIFTISNSMDPASYERNLEIGRRCGLVLPAFGIHPWNAPQYSERLNEIEPLIEQSPIIGEIGLDYYFVKNSSEFPAQRKVFEFFLSTAREQDKIVNLHTKGAEREIADLLERHSIRRAIVHWYSGPLSALRKMADRGVYFTIGVELLYSDRIKKIAEKAPLELLLTETDNPGGLKWLKGSEGFPSAIVGVVEELARIKRVDFETMKRTICENFLRLAGNDLWLNGYKNILQNGDEFKSRSF